ncbi:MAG: hypothetical protein JWR12_3195 [Mucilaginibacter sp.]|nr:hypothetical protein [Mucilaginibacter sp.]
MKTKNTWNYFFRFSPLIILVWGIFSFIFLPIIPIASGYGWDGVLYGKMGLNFQNMIGQMDSYHSGRIFPAILIHYILVIFNQPLNLKSVLLSYQIYNLTCLVIGSVVWVKITEFMSLSPIAKWISFVALFINYPVLNMYFYYPVLTDVSAFVIGIVLLYSYLKKNHVLLLVITTLSFFTWPTGIIIGILIFIYSNIENKYWESHSNTIKQMLWISLMVIPLVILVLVLCNITSIASFAAEFHLKGKLFEKLRSHNKIIYYSFNLLLNSVLVCIYFILIYWYILKDFNFLNFIKESIERKVIFKLLISIAYIFLLIYIKSFFYNPKLPTVTPLLYANVSLRLSTRFPLQFFICNVTYWGPAILLLIIFFKSFADYLKTHNLPIVIGLLFTIIFSVNAESRSITNFYPFIIFILVQVIDFYKIKNLKFFMFLFIVSSLVYSKIWLVIKLPSTTYPNFIMTGLDKFPLQWYFMNLGLWINSSMYLIHATVTVILFVLFYFAIHGRSSNFTNSHLNK